jgi:presqualene diphosphate synthase
MTVAMPQANADATAAATRAGGSSFYAAMRILPRAQREGMFQVYSFCRDVDDIADGNDPRPWRLARLAQWRQDIDALYEGRPPAPLRPLADVARRFSLRKADFLAVIDGMEMDAVEDIRAPAFAELDLYCDRVASAVGRLSVRIFGMEEDDGQALAHHLGRALQLTNILRDVDEDAGIGRLYLPREALQSAGISATDPAAVIAHPAIGHACVALADRAREHFLKSDAIMAHCPRRTIRAPKIMAEVYRRMLDGMVARGWSAPRRRVRLSRPYLLWTVMRHAFP